MATSGTTSFSPDIGTLVEESFERAGLEVRSGYDLKTARRSLDFLLAEWANRGLNLWTIAEDTITLVAGQDEYDLPTDCVDLIEHVCRTQINGQNTDITLQRISVSTYAQIPNKGTTGRPYQIYVKRDLAPTCKVWPIPDTSTTYTLVFWYLRRIEDSGQRADLTFDIPFRFYNALAAGLAYMIALKKPEAYERVPMLKELYEEAFNLAADEDRDRASVRFLPFSGYQL